jgi:hypothetical protein
LFVIFTLAYRAQLEFAKENSAVGIPAGYCSVAKRDNGRPSAFVRGGSAGLLSELDTHKVVGKDGNGGGQLEIPVEMTLRE